jgi:quercetin dioxygenase-like cupin family protein
MMSTAYPARTVLAALAAAALAASPAPADDAKVAAHVMVSPSDLQWADGPGSLPPGAKFAVIEGDPKNAALFTMRVKVPAGYKIPAHWHPADEHVTVISGTFHMGLGDKLDATKGKGMGPGSFMVMPAHARHYAWANEETVIQLHGMGPWGITYVNPGDDPRKK